MKHEVNIPKDKIKEAIDNTNTMSKAAAYLNINYRTFKKIATKYNLYVPKKGNYNKRFDTEDILNGKHPQYPTSKLSKRLVSENYLEYICNKCGISSYNNEHITLELNHIDGNSYNHKLDNLELLCPNCHSQTPTYRSKKLKHNKNPL